MRRADFNQIVAKFFRYAGVGVICTAAHYLVLVVLVGGLGFRPLVGSSAGFMIGALVNYVLNYRYTFRSDHRHREALPKFYLVAVTGFLLNGMVILVLAERLGLQYLLAQVVASGILLIWGFSANHFWTFRQRPDT
jgi:putative flippase GtrA